MGKPNLMSAVKAPLRVPSFGGSRSANTPQPNSRYLHDRAAGLVTSRAGPLTESRDDIRLSWREVASISKSLLQNSAQLKGAADQVIVDTVGTGLRLNFKPDLTGFDMTEEQKTVFKDTVERRYKQFRSDAEECDHRGKFNQNQLIDISLRYSMAFGESLFVHSYFSPEKRKKYGIETGTKTMLITPTRLAQDTKEAQNLFQGVYHDEEGRPVRYRIKKSASQFSYDHMELDAKLRNGLPQVTHVFDANDSGDVRGIGAFASAISRVLQSEKLDEVTLKMAILQTNFAISLVSDYPSQEAFEALSTLDDIQDGGHELKEDFVSLFQSQLDGAANSKIRISDNPQINNLAPGERLDIQQVGVPGQHYLPLKSALSREAARAIGISSTAYTGDYSNATYSSVRMENATIHPLAVRRRERLVVPVENNIFMCWLDEEIGEGRIPFPPGLNAFRKRRKQVANADWHGPGMNTADDFKSAKAAGERLESGISSLTKEAAERGDDFDTIFAERKAEHERFVAAGMASPYDKPKQPVKQGERELGEDDDK
jgi:lambda family phage portal protein